MNALTLRAAALKKQFKVFGQYYAFKYQNVTYACRSTLDLITNDAVPSCLSDVCGRSPDLLVVMLNPGSSRPLDTGYCPCRIRDLSALQDYDEVVPAVPDTTQYQVMRLMAALGYRHARILNLSDLRTPKSARLLQNIRAMSGQTPQWHSVFSIGRRLELRAHTGADHGIPVIIGWGRFKEMYAYARLCLDYFQTYAVRGVPVGVPDELLYAHPSPMLQAKKNQWLRDMLTRFRQ